MCDSVVTGRTHKFESQELISKIVNLSRPQTQDERS